MTIDLSSCAPTKNNYSNDSKRKAVFSVSFELLYRWLSERSVIFKSLWKLDEYKVNYHDRRK